MVNDILNDQRRQAREHDIGKLFGITHAKSTKTITLRLHRIRIWDRAAFAIVLRWVTRLNTFIDKFLTRQGFLGQFMGVGDDS